MWPFLCIASVEHSATAVKATAIITDKIRALKKLQHNQETDIIKGTFKPRQGALSNKEHFHR